MCWLINSSKLSHQYLNFHCWWRWWHRIQAIFWNLFYFKCLKVVKLEVKKKCYWNPTRWHYPLINYFNQTQVLAYQNFKNKTPAVWHRCHTPFIRHHIFNSIHVILPNGWKIYWGFYTFRVSRLNISIKLIDSLKFIQSDKAANIWKKSPNSIWCYISNFLAFSECITIILFSSLFLKFSHHQLR